MALRSNSKVCLSCKTEQPITNYSPSSVCRGGRQPRCKKCRAEQARSRRRASIRSITDKRNDYIRHIKYKYGISLDQYYAILKRQGGGCAICGKERKEGKILSLVVDHCHSTGRVRGILCHYCNTTLGKLGDNCEGVMRLVAYLRPDIAEILQQKGYASNE